MPRCYLSEVHKRVAPKRERIRPVIDLLAAEHQDAAIALRFRSPLELLVSVMLSAQTTDVNVNRVTTKLFEKYHRPEDYLAVTQEELEREIFATGFYHQKARSLQGTMRVLLEEFDGEVPDRFDDLLRLPGVARKTAGVVLGTAYGLAENIVVDTHVQRLAMRLGLTRSADVKNIEQDLMKVIPQGNWIRFSHQVIWHGRRVCFARKPACGTCTLAPFCPSAGLEG